jgi:hypothetical protein
MTLAEQATAAREDFERTADIAGPGIARALFVPPSPAVHWAGLAAWADLFAQQLAEIHGDNDRDWLRR